MGSKDGFFKGETSRRGFLGVAGKLGVGAIAGLAGVATSATAAWAGNAACCNLYFPPGSSHYCRGDGSGSFLCPSPGNWQLWYCCTGSRTYACAECTTGADCEHGTFLCSAYWTTNTRGCSVPTQAQLIPHMDKADLARWNSAPWGPPVTEEELAYKPSIHFAQTDK